jgi:CRISPR-associated protein Cas2
MLEVKAGIFVGTLTARIRDELWSRATAGSKSGACLLIWSAQNEQGFSVRCHGEPSYRPVDIEGLLLVRRPSPTATVEESPQIS